MQNEKMIARIREGGIAQGAAQIDDRNRLLRDAFGFRVADRAEYALIASCFNPYLEPADMEAFARLLDHFQIDYTLLPREYCCGDPFYLHAIDQKHDGDLKQADDLAREFFRHNLEQAQAAGADKLIVYCAGCDLVFNRIKDDIPAEIIWHPTLLERLFQGGRLDLQADFYPGCHRYRRQLLGNTPDIDAVLAVLNRIDGLTLNPLDEAMCCMQPDQLESLAGAVRNQTVITPCSGCSMFLRKALAEKGNYRVLLPSQVIWWAVQGRES